MKKYKIIIEETVNDEFTIEANNKKEAVKLAEEKYKNCDFVLSPGNLTNTKLAVLNTNEDLKDENWITIY